MPEKIFRMPEHHYEDGSVLVTPISIFDDKQEAFVTIGDESGENQILLMPGAHMDSVIRALKYLNIMHRTDGKVE